MKLTIEPEFRDLIPPLAADERKGLEESIAREGCRDVLTVWRGRNIIIDGHNRYEICTRLGVAFDVKELDFADADEAKIWIIRNQFARRNLNDYQRSKLALKLKPLIAGKAKANQGKRTDLPKKSAECSAPIETREELAKAAGVSHDTITKVETIEASPVKELADMTSTGQVSINAAAEVAKLPEEQQRAVVKAGPKAVRNAAKAKQTGDKKKRGIGKATLSKAKSLIQEIEEMAAKPVMQISVLHLREKVAALRELFADVEL